MGIRNSKELGENLLLMAKRLLANQNLCKLLIYNDNSPLSHLDIVDTKKTLLHKNIRVIPKMQATENTQSRIALLFDSGNVDAQNSEFKNISLQVLVYVPLEEWILNSDDLRPFMIMSEIETSLKNKKIEGVGALNYDGFELNLLTDDMSCYSMSFNIDVFN